MVGCAGSFPGPDSGCSAYLVESGGFRLLMDFGTGSLGALQRLGRLHDLDAVVLSHLHADHVLDACSYLVVRRYAPAGPLPPVPLYGPPGTARRLAAAYDGRPDGPVDDVYDVREVGVGTHRIGPFEVTLARVNHPVETYGMRVSDGTATLAYSADTGRSEALVELAHDADAFLCEASFLDDEPHPDDLHLTGGEAGTYAARAGVRLLLLTHLVDAWGDRQATVAAARAVYDGPVEAVTSGAVYDLP